MGGGASTKVSPETDQDQSGPCSEAASTSSTNVVTVLPRSKSQLSQPKVVDTFDDSGGGFGIIPKEPMQERRCSQSSTTSASASPTGSSPSRSWSNVGRGDLQPGTIVRLHSLVGASHLNGQEATVLLWDQASSRWLIRLGNGEEKRVKAANLQALDRRHPGMAPAGSSHSLTTGSQEAALHRANSTSWGEGGSVAESEEAKRQLEALLLQSNWSAIYQLFHSRFGISALDKLSKGQVVKSAVEMTLSIVAKCFALLRSDPSGRLHCTPLHIAALQSSQEATEVIVHEMPNMVQQTHLPSHIALCPLHIAILCGAYSVAELLLDGRANPNVRTLHDVCPMHLAASTSKDMCQLLLAYRSEPHKRDVMGSSAVHYAVAFKRMDALEVLLSSANGSSLARDLDQKRVTPLHIGCALHSDDSDLHGLMLLLANGAKPWQADLHGAPARELLSGQSSKFLQSFFEEHGDQIKAPAQAWLDQQALHGASSELQGQSEGPKHSASLGKNGASSHHPTSSSDNSPVTTAGSTSGEGGGAEQTSSHKCSKGSNSKGSNSKSSSRGGGDITAIATQRDDVGGTSSELTKEVATLRQALRSSREQCAALMQEKGRLEHIRSKCSLLEESAANQQKVFDNLQTLHEAETTSHREHLETLNRRHAIEIEDLKATFQLKLEAAQVEVEEERRHSKQAKDAANVATIEDLRSQLEAAKVQVIQQTTKAEAAAKKKDEASLQKSLEALCRQHHIQPSAGASADGSVFNEALLKALDEELTRLKQIVAQGQGETKALRAQLQQRQEEASSLSRKVNELLESCRRLELDAKDKENRSASQLLKLEMQLKDSELHHNHALAALQAEVDGKNGRFTELEENNRQLESKLETSESEMRRFRDSFLDEQRLRKKYHNQIQDMKGAIRVYCRFRPLIAREAGEGPALKKTDGFTVSLSRPGPQPETKSYGFDSVFDSESTQDDVFSECRDLVQSAVDGYNVTIFAYGQTGAGKTHTMYGTPDQPGLAPRSIQAVFEVIQKEQQRGKTYRVKTYIVEIYKQDILDLLNDKPPAGKEKKGLEVRKDVGRGMMYVDGVTEVTVTSPEELMGVLSEAEKRRHVSATKMNAASSRSHLLLSIIIECNNKDTNQVLYGKITLCDLAGSERPKKSEVSGDGLKEAIEINKSLSSLGDVIEALTKGAKSVPYRNHKLTMLMQDSLGGSAKTLMFVNCSPAGSNYEETTMSLKWATRARQVTNDVKRNADSKEVARLKQVIAMMSAAQNAETILDGAGPEAANLQDTKRDLELAMNATMRH